MKVCDICQSKHDVKSVSITISAGLEYLFLADFCKAHCDKFLIEAKKVLEDLNNEIPGSVGKVEN